MPSAPGMEETTERRKAGQGRRTKRFMSLLTEEQKRSNHIASEQRRRQHIREGLTKLAEMVPGLDENIKSEALILERAVDHLSELVKYRQQLVEKAQQLRAQLS